jgi:hypothetical protein
MNLYESLPDMPESPAASHRVSISRYVNEPLPNWQEFLSAHDVARLPRRLRWLLVGMAIIGRFPRKQQFRGRSIGWLRSHIVDWMTKEASTTRTAEGPGPRRRKRTLRRQPIQRCLLFGPSKGELALHTNDACQRRHILQRGTRSPRR